MFRFIASRLLQAILVIYIIATMVFFMMKAVPGGPFSQDKNVSDSILAQMQEQYGLDESTWQQYQHYIWNITPKKINIAALFQADFYNGLGIDFGYSFRYEGRTVNELITASFPVSLELGFYALLFASFMGITVGTLAALKQNSFWDYWPMAMMLLGICIPAFVLAPLLMKFFGFMVPESLRLPVLFWEGTGSSGNWSSAAHKILPTITLGFYYAAGIARLTRGSMLEVMSQDFIRTARAKGLREATVIIKHGLRAGLTPVISYMGPVAAHLITGSFVVETIFLLPGLGRHLINASLNRDYTLIMGTVLLYACVLMVFNFIVDIVVVTINPKLKLGTS